MLCCIFWISIPALEGTAFAGWGSKRASFAATPPTRKTATRVKVERAGMIAPSLQMPWRLNCLHCGSWRAYTAYLSGSFRCSTKRFRGPVLLASWSRGNASVPNSQDAGERQSSAHVYGVRTLPGDHRQTGPVRTGLDPRSEARWLPDVGHPGE